MGKRQPMPPAAFRPSPRHPPPVRHGGQSQTTATGGHASADWQSIVAVVAVAATALLLCAIVFAIVVRGHYHQSGEGGIDSTTSATSPGTPSLRDDRTTGISSAAPTTDPTASFEGRAANDLQEPSGNAPTDGRTQPTDAEVPKPTTPPAAASAAPHSALDTRPLPESSLARPRYQLMSPGSPGGPRRGAGKPYQPSPPGQFFGLKAEGRRIVFVVDKSGSMALRRFEIATRELVNAVRGLEKGQHFQVILFDELSLAMPGAPMKPVSPDSLRRLRDWLAHITPDGGTDPTAAIQDAMRGTPDCIFFLSDGEFPESVRAFIASLAPELLIIHTISLELDSPMMLQIAEDHRGVYRYVP